MDVPTIENALSVDVEDYFQVSAFAGQVSRGAWEQMPSRVAANTGRVLELLEAHGVRATFFVLGWVGARHPQLVRRIHEAGHEVACHGYSHELVYRQDPAVFRAETQRAKALLEQAIGAPVVGYRAASFSIVPRSRWALDVLVESGFSYDSSIYPVRHDRYGDPDAPLQPHRVATPQGAQLAEFPPGAVDLLGQRLPVGGGGYFRLYPYALSRALLRRVNRGGQPFVFYFHPWEIDLQQPRIAAPPLSRFRHYQNLHRCAPRLHRLLREFRFAPVRDVLRQHGLLDQAGSGPKERAHG